MSLETFSSPSSLNLAMKHISAFEYGRRLVSEAISHPGSPAEATCNTAVDAYKRVEEEVESFPLQDQLPGDFEQGDPAAFRRRIASTVMSAEEALRSGQILDALAAVEELDVESVDYLASVKHRGHI